MADFYDTRDDVAPRPARLRMRDLYDREQLDADELGDAIGVTGQLSIDGTDDADFRDE